MFRRYTEADHAACLAILDSNVPRYFSYKDREDFLAFLKEPPGIKEPQGIYSVLEDQNGIIVGCGGIGTRREGTIGILTWGMIHSERHRQRWGSHLTLTRLAQLSEIPSIKKIVLDTSNETIGFYKKLGFEETAFTPNGYGPGLHRYDMEIEVNEAFRQRHTLL